MLEEAKEMFSQLLEICYLDNSTNRNLYTKIYEMLTEKIIFIGQFTKIYEDLDHNPHGFDLMVEN